MLNFSRMRYTAGNICFVLFIAFLFTILVSPFTMVGSAEAALVATGDSIVPAYEDSLTYENYEFLIQLAVSDPLSSFDSISVEFMDADGAVITVYGDEFTKTFETTDSVYGAVYSLVYDVPETFTVPDDNQVYGTVYVDEQPLYDIIMTLPTPPDEGSSSSSSSSSSTTVSDSTEAEVAAEDLVGTEAEEVSVEIGDVTFTIPAGALDVPELAELIAADPDLEVTIQAEEVTPAAVNLADIIATPGYANFIAIGKVFNFEIVVVSDGQEYNITKFAQKIRVAIAYDDSDVAGINEGNLIAARITQNGLVALGGEVDAVNNLVWFETDSFSNYTLCVKTCAFADIMSHWAKNDVQLLADNGIINGVSDNAFAPEANITRAEFATMLVRALGLTAVNPAVQTFKDVNSTAWYYQMVETAAANGLVAGYNGNFNPNGKINRQEMAVMIVNALQAGGKNVGLSADETAQQLGMFADSQQIADWAKQSVAAAVKEGIINGRTANTFAGLANATRAEGAVMIKRELNALGQLQ
ncbi:S-layer homology domain-containing protein [Phosphitispora sp. TUW77]|uniref:S-layer homology domain-containing protein n=1 Tax=Phosphitispora sp. TUW77 TaxID=3152361 RepID=UPI003AB802EF